MQVVNAAVAGLVQDGIVTLEPNKKHILRTSMVGPMNHEIEAAIVDYANDVRGKPLVGVTTAAKAPIERLMYRLDSLGLLMTAEQASIAKGISLCVALIAPALGVIKIMVGLSRDRPVMYLACLCILSVVVNFLVLFRPMHRSRYGDAVLKQMRHRYGYLGTLGHVKSAVPGQDVAMAVSLFGMSALDGWPMAQHFVLVPREQGSSCISGCGGGGSTCGGGGGGCGGGGGGCGGCGGGH